MILTIVIPTKNEEHNIINLLDCLQKQTFTEFNIVVSDNKSIDNTIKNIKSHDLIYKTTIVDGGLPSIGRNRGTEQSKSEFLLFIDADIIIKDINLIKKSINLMKNKNLDLITTYLSCVNNVNVKFIYFLSNIFSALSKFDKPYSTGMYFMIRKQKFDDLGGFNEKDQYAEDYNLSRKINRKKFEIVKSFVYSNDRRFKKLGYFGVIKLFLKTLINRNDENYYKKNLIYF